MGKRLTIFAMALVLVGLGCGGEGTGPSETVASVEVTPSPAAVVVGQSLQLTATPRAANGTVVNGRTVTWSSSDPSMVSVSATGVVTGIAPGGPVVSARVDGKTGSTQVSVAAATATQLGIVTQPASGAQSGLPLSQQPRVQLRGATNTPVAQAGVVVSAALASGTGTLLNAEATTDASGTATFTGLSIAALVGTYALRFDAPGLTSVTSDVISVAVGPAGRLALATPPPATAQSGTPFAPQPTVQLQDAGGNPVAQGSVLVTASIASGPGGTVAGATATTNAAGLATFSGLALTGPTGSYTMAFGATGLAPATSGTIVLGSGSAGQVTITTQPSGTAQSGVPLGQQPVVVVRDGGGNPLANQSVTASIASGGGSLGGVTTVTTNQTGTASFPNLAITGLAGPRTLRFTSGAVGATSATIVLGAGPASAIAMATQPSSNAQSGVALPQQPAVQLQDGGGNAVSQSGVSITAGFETGTGTIANGTAVTDLNGVATFSGLSITGLAGTYSLRFTSNGMTPAASASIALGAGVPAGLTIATQPSASAQSSIAFGQPPRIQLRDAAGNPVSQAGVSVTASIATSPGGSPTVANATATTDGGGIANFGGIAITGLVGTYTLGFASAGLTGTTSTSITLSAGPPAKLAVTTQPSSSAQSGAPFAQQPRVQLRDAADNTVSQSGVLVTASVASGPGGGTVANATATTNGSGLAVFSGLSLTGTAGTYTLGFAASGLTGTTSAAITLGAGAAAQLSITTQPSSGAASGSAFAQQPRIQLRDGGGNAVSQAGVSVTAVIASGPGGATLTNASATTDGSGLATFSGLAITGSDGDYTLRFESTGLSSVTSTPITLSPAATRVTIEVQPPGTGLNGVALSPQPAVQLRDNAGNPIGQSGVTITASVATGPGGFVGNSSAVTNASGRATFSGLYITGPAGSYTLSFGGAGLTPATSTSIAIAYSQGTYTNLTYCSSPGGDLKMDLYVPSNGFARPLPAAVFIHGGGWTSGDKATGALFNETRDELLSRGYLVFSFDYRLAPTWQWPAQIHDVKCGIRSLRANAGLYGLDQARIGTWGHSAGGHLAAMLGVTDASSGFEGSLGYSGFSSRVRGAVPFGAITDLTQGPGHPELNFGGPEQTFSTWPGPSSELTNASPITWASPDDPAFYHVHGQQDTVVLPAQAQRLHGLLQSAGVNTTLLLVTNGGHSLENVGGPANPSNAQTVNLIANFFDNNVK